MSISATIPPATENLPEGDGEQVMEHECHPLGRPQGVHHHQQGQADPLGQQRLVLGGPAQPM